jgi:arginine deiminase
MAGRAAAKRGERVGHSHGADSEVGRLRAVLAHRPGAELRRITPRTPGPLLFRGLPWVERAQQEHDIWAQALRDHDVEVLYVTELLQDVMEYRQARDEAISAVTGDARLGARLRADLRGHLSGLDPEALAQALVAGLAAAEFRPGRGVVYGLLDRHDFVIPPLPNLVFLRDSSAWIGPAAVVATLASPGRAREPALMAVLYRHHPRFAGTPILYGPALEPLDGADILQLAPGVVAVGASERTTPAGVERLAGSLFAAGVARTVLAVPMRGLPAAARLDTICTVVGAGTLLMSPGLAYTLQAHVISPGEGEPRISRAQPFLESAARAMGTGALTLISTGLEPPASSRQQWDDGGNALVIGTQLVICHERNTQTNARLAAAGIEVIEVPGSELAGERGGPRGMSCVLHRDPLPAAARDGQAAGRHGPADAAPPRPAARAAQTEPDPVELPAAPGVTPALIPAATLAPAVALGHTVPGPEVTGDLAQAG